MPELPRPPEGGDDAALAEALRRLDLGPGVPAPLQRAAAAALAWTYALDREAASPTMPPRGLTPPR